MKQQLILLPFFISIAIAPAIAITIQQDSWKLVVSEATGETDIFMDNTLLISNVCGNFKIDETRYYTASLIFEGADVDENYSDALGSGKRVNISYRNESPAFDVIHSYFLYSGKEYILTELKINASEVIFSNYISPLCSATQVAFLPDNPNENIALIVPFDNDAWVRYASNPFTNTTTTSYEVGCLFNKVSRNGLVLGSVEHDKWKTGVVYKTSPNNRINAIDVFGGIADNAEGTAPSTRDLRPHGKIKGNTLKSPKIFIGFFDDWRTGMETYGEVNAVVAPKLVWEGGVPFGWNSWGNAHMNLSYAVSDGVSEFFASYLQPDFSNHNTLYMSMDAFWDNMTYQNRQRLVQNCHDRGQKIGIYWTPFSDWSGNEGRIVEGTNNQYTYGDIHLKVNGQKRMLNNGYALDPTHPGTKMREKYYIDQFIRDGYEYYKIDFMSHGALEGDSYYDPEVTTGIQAYNHGFDYIVKYIDGRMFINLGIAPVFPAQYAHTRHICCESYGAIGDTHYELNALSHAWWQDRVYFCNNPDVMVFGIFQNYPRGYSKHPIGVNRARMTSVVTTGMTLFGDDFVNCTDLTRSTAIEFAKNTEITRIGKSGKSFKPVEGGWGTEPADLFMQWLADTLYLAAYHLSATPPRKTFSIDYTRVNLPLNTAYVIHELWMNEKVITNKNENVLTLDVPRTDARVFKIYPAGGAGIENTATKKTLIYPNPASDYLMPDESLLNAPADYRIYDVIGRKMMEIEELFPETIHLNALREGVYFLVRTDQETQEKMSIKLLKIK